MPQGPAPIRRCGAPPRRATRRGDRPALRLAAFPARRSPREPRIEPEGRTLAPPAVPRCRRRTAPADRTGRPVAASFDPSLAAGTRLRRRPRRRRPSHAARRRERRRLGGISACTSPPVSFTRTTNGRRSVYVTTVSEQGSMTMRWNRSRWMPSASATTALITSPCEQANQVAAGPSLAFHSRTAAIARAWVRAATRRPHPGKSPRLGCAWTTFQSGSFASFLSSWPVQSP